MKTAIAKLTCCVLLSISTCAADETKIATPEEMLKALAEAKCIEVTGNPPYDQWTQKQIVRYPVRLERPADLHQIFDFFRLRDLRISEESTKAFREGARIGTDMVSIVTIDGKKSFTILSLSIVVFGDYLTYGVPETPGPLWCWFHQEFAHLLKRLQATNDRVSAKKPHPK